MDKSEIEAELSADSPTVRAAVLRGIAAVYGADDWNATRDEYAGHIMAIIVAVRAAVEPLI